MPVTGLSAYRGTNYTPVAATFVLQPVSSAERRQGRKHGQGRGWTVTLHHRAWFLITPEEWMAEAHALRDKAKAMMPRVRWWAVDRRHLVGTEDGPPDFQLRVSFRFKGNDNSPDAFEGNVYVHVREWLMREAGHEEYIVNYVVRDMERQIGLWLRGEVGDG